MKPYFQDDYVTLYHGDCLELADVWTGADVLVTDPPYGMGYESGGHRKRGKTGKSVQLVSGDDNTSIRDRALSLFGSVNPSLVFGRWSVERPSGTKQLLIWNKGNHTGMGDTNIPWRPSFEEVYVRGSWPERKSLGRGGGGRVSPILHFNATAAVSESQGRLHPTEKPVGLMEHLIERCPPGVVADPFAGSGSTLLAARNLGRKVIGVELEEKYCEVIAKRLQQQSFDFTGLEAL